MESDDQDSHIDSLITRCEIYGSNVDSWDEAEGASGISQVLPVSEIYEELPSDDSSYSTSKGSPNCYNWVSVMDSKNSTIEEEELDCLEETYESKEQSETSVDLEPDQSRSFNEVVQMFKLRANLARMDVFHSLTEKNVDKIRQKLKLCCQDIESLEREKTELEKQLEKGEVMDISTPGLSLRSRYKELCTALENEKEVKVQITAELMQLELKLNQVEVDLGKVSTLQQDVEYEVQHYRRFKTQKATARLQQEKKASRDLVGKNRNLQRKHKAMLEKDEANRQRKAEESHASYIAASKHWKQTMIRFHQQAAEKELEKAELVERRTQVVNSLKSNIKANQEILKSQQVRANDIALKKTMEEKQLKESMEAQGLNSTRHLYQQKQQEEAKRRQKQFDETQKLKRMQIVTKILREDEWVKKRTAKQPLPLTRGRLPGLGREKPVSLPDANAPAACVEQDSLNSSVLSCYEEIPDDFEDTIQEDATTHTCPDSLAEPEFSGLWDRDYEKLVSNAHKPMERTEAEKNQSSFIAPKMVSISKKHGGRELKGPSFISKPEVILYKDFEVGKVYKKKIILTNISYTINYCQLLKVSPHLKNFITVIFEPPGSLSTGMSCEIQTVFQPMLNEDMEGDILFASPLGSFSVPVRCYTKKCNLEVDNELIDFGSHIVGQAISQTITLTNKGALGTSFKLETSTYISSDTSQDPIAQQIPDSTSQVNNQDVAIEKTSVVKRNSVSSEVDEVQPKQDAQEVLEPPSQEQSETDLETLPEVSVPAELDTQLEQSTHDECDIKLGRVKEGEIGPFESIKLEVIFTPTIPGETTLEFSINFSDVNSKPITILVKGTAITTPVWVVQPFIDLKICMFDFMYQECITIQSRATAAMKLTFDVCNEMKKHMKILPKTCFIQAHSSFNAHLRFLPRSSLAKDAEKFFDPETGVLEVPLTVEVSGQVHPAHFTVQAVVTCTDLQFDHSEVDFGLCSIYLSAKSTVRLTNLSLVPQDFGFLSVPEFMKIQPNDGFGTLLPQETLPINLIFSPKIATDYHFHLTCKSGVNRDFMLSCRAVCVQPPLELSNSLVQFRATAVGDQSTAIVYLLYSHGQSKTVPRLFSFTLPENSDVSVSPSAGRLLPGQRCQLLVIFKPRLTDIQIKEEALRQFHQAELLREQELEKMRLARLEAKPETPVEPTKGRKGAANQKNIKVVEEPKMEKRIETPNPDDILPGTEYYEQAKTSLLCSFSRCWNEYIIPCFVSDGDPPKTDRLAQPTWSHVNTLYLKIQCPTVRPPLLVVSNNGYNVVDFHQVLVGRRQIKKITIQNISEIPLNLKSSILNVIGPFSLLNALRCINPGEHHTLILAFIPAQEKQYVEIMELQCRKMVLEITLRGNGVMPAISFSHTGGPLDFGYILQKDTSSQTLQLENNSVLAVNFRVLLASQFLSKPQKDNDTMALLLEQYGTENIELLVGTQNYNGLSVFTVLPPEGSIAPGQSQDIVITFQPDHPSVNYTDKLTIELINEIKACVDLKGAASSHNMYLSGGDPLTVPIESLLPQLVSNQTQLTDTGVVVKPTIPVLVTLRARCVEGAFTPAVRELKVGYIRTPSSKKNGEFTWDGVAPLQQLGFTVDPIKASIEPGLKRSITITWTPQGGYKPFEVVQTSLPLTIKGDETHIYKVTLMGLVSTATD